jgi:hypothetical protein
MTPDPRGYKVTIVGTRLPILALSYWVIARSVALELFSPPLTDTVPFRHPLLPPPDPTHFPLSAYFLCGHTLSLLVSYTAGCSN